MLLTETHTRVLIVGAGPSGLMMAAQLLRNGVQPIIIDSKPGATNQSKALAVQARSLEIYRQMGIIDKVLEQGLKAEAVVFNIDKAEKATLSLARVGDGQTRFPFILMYQQSKNERLLLDYLTLNCCPVYWETTLMSLTQSETTAQVQLQSGGHGLDLTCDYVVGADGAHSAVRKLLNVPFSGDSYQHDFYLADVGLDNPEIDHNKVHLYLAKHGFSAFFPMPENGRFRLLGNLLSELKTKKELALDDILPGLKAITGVSLDVTDNYWTTAYRLHHRIADRFRVQRCFLIGDAAHIHSPVGGQGMNTGLQDAYNLAWKLAGVVNSQLDVKLLDSYADERVPIAKELLNSTDKAFNIITSRSWFNGLFKKWVLPGLLKYAWGNQKIRNGLFKRISQTGISYRDGALSLHLSQAVKVKAGDRLPYLKVFDEKRQQETDLHEWCTKPGFTLIILGKLAETDLFALAKWITLTYPARLNFFYLPPSVKNQHVFDAFETRPNQGKSLIVRPDMYLGFVNDKVDMVLMDNYLKSVVGVLN